MNHPLDVTIIIASWNTRDILRDCLRSIYDHAGETKFEIIVIDNASADGSADMVATEFEEINLIRNLDNLGFSKANNQGILQAKGRYVLLLNPDTIVHHHAIEKVVSFADAHEDAAIVGCRTLYQDGRLQHNCFTFPSFLNMFLALTRLSRWFWRNRFFGRYRLTWWDYKSVREVDAVAGCFMLVRKNAVDEVGMLSEDYFMYSEDTDWCWRFRQKGWKILYTPDAVITHLSDASGSQSPIEMNLQYRRSQLLFLEKKSGRLVRAAVNILFGITAFVRLIILTIKKIFHLQQAEMISKQWKQAIAAVKYHWFGNFPRSS